MKVRIKNLETLTKESFINIEHKNSKKQQLDNQNEYNSKFKKNTEIKPTNEDIAKENARNNFLYQKIKKEK